VPTVTGRYVLVTVGGVTYQIYSESAGSGQDLLCMHTAGADGRQFHGLMADPRIVEQHRLVSFDLPWHGKSPPPEGAIQGFWWLNTDLYIDHQRTDRRAQDNGLSPHRLARRRPAAAATQSMAACAFRSARPANRAPIARRARYAARRRLSSDQTVESAWTRPSMSASLCNGEGVRRSRSVPRRTVG
jgi:hypothetical protein